LRRDPDGIERQERRHEVGAGMGRLRDEREASRGEPRDQLDRDQRDGGSDRRERGAAKRRHERERYSEGGAERRRRSATSIAAPMRMPPAISMGASVSDKSTTASAAARNGWRFAARVSRAVRISAEYPHTTHLR